MKKSLPFLFNKKRLSLPIMVLFVLFSNAAFTQVSGTVFRDLPVNGAAINTYGVKDANETAGVGNVTVTVFGTGGGTTTTAADGSWSIASATGDLRVEFSNWPSYLEESADGGGGNSSVQFTTTGGTVDFGLHNPADFSYDRPQLATTQMLVGDPTSGVVSPEVGILEFGYLSGANGRQFPISDGFSTLQNELTNIAISSAPGSMGTLNAMPVSAGLSRINIASLGDVGCVYGLAFQKESNTLLAAAFMKRFVGLAGGGGVPNALGTIYAVDRSVSPNTTTVFYTANAGVDNHDYSSASLNVPSGDGAAALQAGKVGWGDIDLSSDGKTLYAINLFDKKIYAIPVSISGTGVLAGTATIIDFPASVTSGLCSDDDWVPGAINVRDGQVYVGITCTAETSGVVSDLHYYVYKFAEGTTGAFSQVVDMPNYTWDGSGSWNPWVNSITTIDISTSYGQPWLMDIEFDEFGKIYLGFRNRSSDMRAFFNPANMFTSEFGDILVGLPNVGGTYTMLKDGAPSSYEYIDDNTLHPENSMGAMVVLQGSVELMGNAHIGNLIQGIRTYSSVDGFTTTSKAGAPIRYYGFNQSSRLVPVITDPFGKVAGVGDLELLTAPAPIEIGNLVWEDTDADGVQDAGEPGMSGVTVELLKAGIVIATATTNASGNYIFSNDPNASSTPSHIYNLTMLLPNMDYTVRIPNASGGAKQPTLGTNALTLADVGEGTSTNINDSDGITIGLNADAPVLASDIPAAGVNNHTFDFGFLSCPPARCSTVTIVEN